jgi:murein L,D-transpeptidase YafK
MGVAGCNDQTVKDFTANAYTSFSPALVAEMGRKKMTRESPIMGRIFKEEGKLEIWKQTQSGAYAVIASYDICKYSGKLGPKYTEGDRQAPEGFYTVRPAQMNPNSKFTLAFNLGYPNAYDKANGRTGANLMVHGACSSSGCYSMTDPQMKQIFAFAAEAFKGGQREFQVQAFPFKMTAGNMARYRNDPNYPFWKMLKEGYDEFEITKQPPRVDVCEKRYVFNRKLPDGTTLSATGACPAPTTDEGMKSAAYQSYHKNYTSAFDAALEDKEAPAAKASINGLEESKLVADWTKRRARGERISVEPPVLRDGKAVITSPMGRANSEAGRRMAALEAAEAEKKRLAAEKLAAEKAEKERKHQEKIAAELAKIQERNAKAAAKAEADAAKAKPKATADAAAEPTPTEAAAAPATAEPAKPGMFSRLRKKATGAIGNLLGGG